MSNPQCTQPLAIGHRGVGGVGLWAPENTLASLEMAWRMGADSIEIDVRDTADGIPVLMHDDTVDRTTNGSGRVDALTLAQIRELRSASLNPDVPHQCVPTFREALAFLHGKTLVDVDIKGANIPRLVRIIAEEDMLKAAYLLIGSVAEGFTARAVNPGVALMPKVSTLEEVRDYLDTLSPIAVFEIEYADATPAVVDFIHAQGIKIHMDALGMFDIQGYHGYRTLIERGADLILTDRLEVLVPYLRPEAQR